MNLSNQRGGWKSIVYVIGGLGGTALGLLSAHLYAQSAEERNAGQPPRLGSGEVVALLLSSLAFVRQIAAMGGRSDQKR